MAKQNLITHQVDGVSVLQRESDGFFNATAMCKASGKLIADYQRLSTTKQFLSELSTDMGIPITALNQVVRGGNIKTNQGTWVHPKVAIHLAQWLSPEFAVQVTNLVFDWMNGGTPPPQLPSQQAALPGKHHYTLQKWQGGELLSSEVVTLPVLKRFVAEEYPQTALMVRQDLLAIQDQVRDSAHQSAAFISRVLQPLQLQMLDPNPKRATEKAMDQAMGSFGGATT